MNTTSYPSEDFAMAKSVSSKKNYKFSFSLFQNTIRENSELRKQIKDIVDLGLYDYALRQNAAFIQLVREKAEAETIDLMMRFASGVDDYQKLKKLIHRNRVIRILAIMDRKAQQELVNKFSRFSLRSN
jgi:hypothetical protein